MTDTARRLDARHLDPALLYLGAGILAFTIFLFRLPEPQPAASAADVALDTSFAIVDALVFDGESFQAHSDVWVKDGRILAVGKRLAIPKDLPRIDGRGHTVLPGLVDAHVHTFGSALADDLRFGVTTVLDQFTAPETVRAQRATRTVLAATDQADLFSAGMIATAPGGHGTQFRIDVTPVLGPGAAPDWVRARKAEGSDWIKIAWEDGSAFGMTIPTLDRDTVAALIAAAHAEGLRAVVHVSRQQRALDAMALGADGLVHVWGDELISEEDAARMAASKMFVIPTLSIVSSRADAMAAKLRETVDPTLLSPLQRDTLHGASPFARGGDKGEADVAIENVRRLHAAGVPLIAGTDAPNPGTAYGVSLHGELRLLQQAGLTATEALHAATAAGVDAFGVSERGRLKAGAIADLVLVDGDASQDLAATLDIITIWKDGFPLDRHAAAVAAVAAPLAPPTTLISDFATGLTSAFGFGWQTTEDRMMGGQSTATLAAKEGVLRVSGEIRNGFAYPWAGAMWFPGATPMAPVDFTGRTTLSFRVRGDDRDYRVMLFSGGNSSGPPPSLGFHAGRGWSTVTFQLSDFRSAEPTRIGGLAFVAQAPAGRYALELDDLEIR